MLVDSNKSEVEKGLLLTNSAFVRSYRTDSFKVLNCPHFASSNSGSNNLCFSGLYDRTVMAQL